MQNIFYVLCERFTQLIAAMFLAAFGKQVEYLATRSTNPVNTVSTIDKTKHFNTLKITMVRCPGCNSAHRILLAGRHSGGGYFNTINLQ